LLGCENLPPRNNSWEFGSYIETILKIALSLGPSFVLKSLFTSKCRLLSKKKKKKPPKKEEKFYRKGGLRITFFPWGGIYYTTFKIVITNFIFKKNQNSSWNLFLHP
jgi:hypothetical protein